MAYEEKILDLSFPAAEDLAADKYKFIVLDAGSVRRPNDETEPLLGILQNAPGIGEAAVVRLIGVSKLQMNDALASGFVLAEFVDATDAGKGKAVAAAPTYARAMILEASGAEDDLATVLLTGIIAH